MKYESNLVSQYQSQNSRNLTYLSMYLPISTNLLHIIRDMYIYILHREMEQLLMDLEFRYLFFTFGVISWSPVQSWSWIVYIIKIHPNTEIRDQNLSPSKDVTFLYIHVSALHICTYLIYLGTYWYLLRKLNSSLS